MHAFRFAVLALFCLGVAHSRPVEVEEVALLTPPDTSWHYFGRFGVAIDGDHALVSGERFVPDPLAENGTRRDGTVFLYRRSGSTWNYQGQLGPIGVITESTKPGLAMKGGVALTITDTARIYELAGSSWTPQPFPSGWENLVQGQDIEIDGGRILVPRKDCYYTSGIIEKRDGAWAWGGEVRGHSNECGDNPPSPQHDIHGNYIIQHNPEGQFGEEPHRAIIFRQPNPDTWERYAHAEAYTSVFGPQVAMNGDLWAITGTRHFGSPVAYHLYDGMYAWAHVGLQPADGFMSPDPFSTNALERFRNLFGQRNYHWDRKAYVINLFSINDDFVHSSNHVATLTARDGRSLGSLFDTSGNRVIANGLSNFTGDNVVRIFEVPATLETPAVQAHDFEAPSSGAAWQPTPGSTFSIARFGITNVYRQESTDGNPGSVLPTSTATNQSIQGEVTIRATSGADRWVGLMTRRQDASNYYYVTLRTSGTVQLRRMVNGVFTTLGSANATVTIGRKYRLRLESIGTMQRVYLDERLVLTARDSALTAGAAGILMNRASADFDNIIVTPSARMTVYESNFSNHIPEDWHAYEGQWQVTGGAFRPFYTADYARAITGAVTDDQVVRARIRPVSFQQPDNWVGLMARYRDIRNYIYVSVRGRGVISLWRRNNNIITQLDSRALTVTPGTWYDVRLEVVNNQTRVFVNNRLYLSSNADPGPNQVEGYAHRRSQVGLITFRATADFDDFLAYQP